MILGYARVSTPEQNLDLQIDALKKYGCDKIFTDKVSGYKSDRIGINKALEFMRPGDVFVVWRLDRLGRSLRDLLMRFDQFKQAGVDFKSIQENIDTATAAGKLQIHVFAAMAEFERDITRERTSAGLVAAKARGRMGGRPQSMTQEKIKIASSLMKTGTNTVNEICHGLKISRSTLYRYVDPKGNIKEKIKTVHTQGDKREDRN